jgi:hypothetical protein
VPAGKIAVSGTIEDYLKICLRVTEACDRAVATLDTFRRRPDVPPYLDGRLARWTDDLRELKKTRRSSRHDPLNSGRELIRDAQFRNAFPNDPQGMVRFVAASGCLHRFLKSNPTDKEQLAETYYLLGVAESYLSPSYWQSETDYLLETAIRTAPRTVFARMAYDFLEEYTVSGYTGSSGVNIPAEVQSRLDELRALVEDSDDP